MPCQKSRKLSKSSFYGLIEPSLFIGGGGGYHIITYGSTVKIVAVYVYIYA